MKVYIGADHRGFQLKQKIVEYLERKSIAFVDVGALSYQPEDDDIDFATEACKKISHSDVGILICGSGHGMDVVANRFRHVRCVVGFNLGVVVQARQHLDANVLALPAEWISYESAIEMIDVFLHTAFTLQDKYVRRLKKLEDLK